MKNLVWLVSYPKSGNTWFRMFLANYQRDTDKPVSLQEIESTPISSDAVAFEEETSLNPFEMTFDEVDLYRPDVYRTISQDAEITGKICFKKTHDAYTLNTEGVPIFPADVSKCAVYFIRNPLDVCISYANHGAKEVSSTVNFILNEEACMAGKKAGQLCQKLMSWKSHVKSWKEQKLIPILIVRYEDMLTDPFATFGSIVKFLGLEYCEERLERAIINSDFKLLKQMEQEDGFKEKMQKCKSFFWKGKIGNYKEYLSGKQIRSIVEYNFDIMKEFGYVNDIGEIKI